MYKLFNVDNNKKSKIKGFWLDDSGKIYVDSIHIKNYTNRQGLNKGVKSLIASGEKCCFHKEGCRGIITDSKGKRAILRHRLMLKRYKLSITEIKTLLKKYNGLTIYNCKKARGLYFIEVFYK